MAGNPSTDNVAPRLLLVDDDASLVAMLREFLELQGFRVDTLPDAESALARIASDPPELLVLDVMMPGMSGFEALRQLRQMPAHQDLPVIMLTARGDESARIVGLLGGADDYLPKPCNPLELAARIRAVLKRARLPAPASQLLSAGPLMRLLGEKIEAMITRLLGVILAALAAQYVIDGIRASFSL